MSLVSSVWWDVSHVDSIQKGNSAQRSPFSLVFITPETDQSAKEQSMRALRVALRDWIEITQDRERRSDEDDSRAVTNYKGIARHLSLQLNFSSSYFMLLTDSDERIQAAVAFSESDDGIFVDALLSAAWNVPMPGEVDPEHQMIAVKGAGLTLMRQVYEFAKQQGLSRLSLHASIHSEGFYSDKLKMTPDGNQNYYFDLSQVSIPAAFREVHSLLAAEF